MGQKALASGPKALLHGIPDDTYSSQLNNFTIDKSVDLFRPIYLDLLVDLFAISNGHELQKAQFNLKDTHSF